VPLALVVPQPGKSPDPAEIREWTNGRVAKPQRVVRVELRESFPRNALGKVLKKELRALYSSA
jgi:acyl-CoA synthetase (AMP-forming)/AMP-acid ligase II